MVSEPLLDASDLSEFPGAPFPAGVVSSAAGQIRSECGWHIAPVVEETITLYTERGRVAILPSLKVVDVTTVSDEAGNALTGWRVWPNGVLRRSSAWPDLIEVTFSHGYETCPPELVGVVADRASRARAGMVRQESLGGRSVSYAASSDGSMDHSIARHSLAPRP